MGNMIIVGPDGKRYKVNAPAGATPEEIEETFARQNGGARGTVTTSEAEDARLTDLKNQYDAYTATPEYQRRQLGLSGNSILDQFDNPSSAPPKVAEQPAPQSPEEIGYLRKAGDLATGLYSGTYRAIGSTVGLGTYVPGLNKIADPVAEYLYGTADFVDEKLLSDFQLGKKRELQADLQASLQDMPPYPEDASTTEKIKYVADYVINQGGAAGSFLKDNPGQITNFIAETVPYILTGGALGKGTSASLNLLDDAVSVGSKAKAATTKAAETTGRYAGAIGEGLVAAGDVGANTAINQRAQGNYDYDPQRLYGLITAPVTATIGGLGSKVSGVADVDTLAARAFNAGTKPTDLVSRSLPGRVTIGAATEGTEELLQGGSEQVFSNLANDEAAYEGVGSSAVLGLATGAALGGGVNTAAYARDKLSDKPTPSGTEAGVDTQQIADEGALKLQMLAEEQTVATQEAQQAVDAQRQLKLDRMEAAKSFMPESEFNSQRAAKVQADVADPSTEIGNNYLEYKLENDVNPANEKEEKAAQKKFLKDFLPSDDAARAKAEFNEALDAYAADLKAGKVTAVPNDKPKVQTAPVDDAAVEAAPATQDETTAEDTPPAADPMTLKVRQSKNGPADAIAKVEALVADGSLPQDWADTNPELESALNAEKFSAKKFDTALQAAFTPEEAPVEETTDEPVNVSAGSGLTENAELRGTLNENQAKIYDAYLNTENPLSVVWNSGETRGSSEVNSGKRGWQAEFPADKSAEIKKLSGIKDPKKATAALSEFKKKLISRFPPEQLREELISQGVVDTSVGARLDQNESQEFAAGAGPNFGTVSSAGGSQAADASATQKAEKQTAERKAMADAGMTEDAINAFFDPENKDKNEQAENVVEDQENEDFAVEKSTPLLRQYWEDSVGKDGPSFDDLSRDSKVDWMEHVYDALGSNKADRFETLDAQAEDIRQRTDSGGTQDGAEQSDEGGRTEVQEPSGEDAGAKLPADAESGIETDRPADENGGESGSQKGFKGKLNLVHGFKPPNYDMFEGQQGAVAPPDFVPNEEVEGQRYDGDGGAYGAEGVYLENPNSGEPLVFNSPEMDSSFFAPATAQVEATFENAFILDPSTVQELETLTGLDMSDELSGAKAAAKLKELGYDGLIVRGFAEAEAQVAKISQEKEFDVELSADQKTRLKKAQEGFGGLAEDLAQNQIIHFKPETLKTVKVFPKSLKEDPSQASNIPRNPTISSAPAKDVSAGVAATKALKRQGAKDTLVTGKPDPAFYTDTGIEAALDRIIQTGGKFEQALARKLKALVGMGDYQLKIVDNPNTDLEPIDFMNFDFFAQDEAGAMAAAKRDYERTKEIWNEANPPAGLYVEFGATNIDAPAGVVMLHGAQLNNGENVGLSSRTFLHEMFHAVTANIIYRVRDGDLVSGPAVDLYDELQELAYKVNDFSKKVDVAELADMMNVDIDTARAVQENVRDVVGTDIHELIAYGFTEPYFQNFMDNVLLAKKEGAPNRTAWTQFVDKIRDFFGLEDTDADTTTALNEVMRLTDSLLAERVAQQTTQSQFSAGRQRASMSKPAWERQSLRKVQAFENWADKSPMFGEAARSFLTDAGYILRNPIKALTPLSKLVRDNAKKLPALGKAYKAMLAFETTANAFMLKLDPIAKAAKELTQDRQNLVNDFISKSTFYQKWGYDPQIKGKKVKVDAIMEAAFNKLTNVEQNIIKAIFMHGENTRKEMEQIAKDLNLPKEYLSVSKLEGPYAPFKRKGGFFTELKSAELVAAEQAVLDLPNKINRDKVEKLKVQEQHYVLKAFGSLSAARKYERERKGAYAQTSATEKEAGFDEGQRVNPQTLSKIMAAIGADDKAGLDNATRNAVQGVIEKIYAESLAENNARLSGLKRKNRAGYDENMLQSFFSHAHGQARLVAQMKHGKEINAELANAREQNKKNNRDTQEVYNLFATHYQRYVNPATGPMVALSDRIASFNTVTTLTSSVGYHVTNAMQPIISQQKMASDFNDYSGAVAAQVKAYKVAKDVIDGTIANAVKNIGRQAATTTTVGLFDFKNLVELDVSKAPPHLRELLEGLQLQQLLDQGIEQDLNFESTLDTGYGFIDGASDKFKNISDRLYQTARYVEAYNRVSVAVAAFEMANKNRSKLAKMKMTAQEYATAVVEDTQGNFSRLDSALMFKALPKLMTQYRKYQVMMMWLWAGAFKKAFFGADMGERMVGARMLGYSAAHTALLSGARGLPFLGTSAMLLPMFLGVDEEEKDPKFDLERYIRTEVFPDDQRMADLFSRGVPSFFGVDMSQKLTQADIFSPFPYSEFEATDDGAKSYVLEVLLGPTSSQIGRGARMIKYGQNGDYLKAIEAIVPKGVRTMMESYRLGTEGYTLNNGDKILDPREFDLTSLMVNALGLPATDVSRVKWTRGQQYEITQYFTKESGKISSAYVEATRDRDRAAQKKLRKEWMDLQRAKDRVRPFFNNAPGTLNRLPMTDLLKKPLGQRKRENKYKRQIIGN
jgi:hypothetical protein